MSMDTSGGFFQLTDELQCDISFDGTQFRGTCYLINRPELGLIGLDWIEKLGLLYMPLKGICYGVHSTSPSLANSNQLATKLMSTILPPAELNKEEKKEVEEEEPGEKAPAASELRQIPGRSTRSGTGKRLGAPTKCQSSSPTTAADSPDLTTTDFRSNKGTNYSLYATKPEKNANGSVTSEPKTQVLRFVLKEGSIRAA